MSQRIDKTQLIDRVAQRVSKPPAEIAPVAEALVEEIYEALKHEKSISLRNFGTFYIDVSYRYRVQIQSSSASQSTVCLVAHA